MENCTVYHIVITDAVNRQMPPQGNSIYQCSANTRPVPMGKQECMSSWRSPPFHRALFYFPSTFSLLYGFLSAYLAWLQPMLMVWALAPQVQQPCASVQPVSIFADNIHLGCE
ncbi:hypothetical protein CYLTODRAFT_417166 [Cylindrobasidium torrendii FP15055 ss-10]|uniref:Uncharacterized protein n=1 Tax=Cylindrobasidium torrendii FP15055 ss-10 TaxID=1314674 RepID=A0A0D7BRP5_9AGAR|nr:hypothetical protein CYLTODRAFT_417166 [Cylindrobasidium torrendii FP15055 ss-10]